jgi:hypothetical protein
MNSCRYRPMEADGWAHTVRVRVPSQPQQNCALANLPTWPSGDALAAAPYLLRVVSDLKTDGGQARGFGMSRPSRLVNA